MNEFLRVYLDPNEISLDGYPFAWHKIPEPGMVAYGDPSGIRLGIKDLIRMQAGNRCERCGHPYMKENQLNSARSEWTPCDQNCTHRGPMRTWTHPPGMESMPGSGFDPVEGIVASDLTETHDRVDAQWRILTVHHLNGVKHDCRWWNLTALCQRCHLTIQGRVNMDSVFPLEHSEWFKPHAAGWYASAYLGEELSREETMERMDELLSLERVT